MIEDSGPQVESSTDEEEILESKDTSIEKETEQNSWEEDSSSDSSVENDSDNEKEKDEKVSVADAEEKSEDKKESDHLEEEHSSHSESASGDSDGGDEYKNDVDGDNDDEDDDDEINGDRKSRRQRSKADDEKAAHISQDDAKENKVWEQNPDIYGIRRSRRARKEPVRLVFKESDSDSEDSITNKKKRRKRGKGWIPTLTDSETESDSSYDVPQRQIPQRKQKASVGRRHGRTISSSSSDFPTRNWKKQRKVQPARTGRNNAGKVSYKEDSDDATDSDDLVEYDEETMVSVPLEDVETIEKIMRHRNGRKGETGAQTTIYAVEAEELNAKGEPDPDVDEIEVQYLIKWKGWSNLHNTWESEDTLVAQRSGGMKKLENYQKKMNDINRWKEVSTPEDVEYFEYQMEMNDDIQSQYQKVERIIAHQFTAESISSYPDYYCKWHGLPYSDCTWEDGALTARFFQSEIDQYLERERSDLIPTKNAKCLRNRPKFVAFKTQPTFVGNENLQLRDYQLDGVNWLVHAWHRETSVILADEMGLGKTIQSISFLSSLFFSHSLYGPFLLVVPLSTLDSWQREFGKWSPDMNVITYIGDVNSRTRIREYEWYLKKTKKIKFNALITTYEILLRDKDILASLQWACLLVDEAHRLKNDDSLLYRILIDFNTNFRVLITGTPLQNSLKELWSLMHFIMPRTFDDWDAFNSTYSISDKDGLQKLHQELEPYLIRRIKKDVETSLPAKVEQILRVEMSQVQKQYYKLILTKNVEELCKELKGSFSGLLNIIVELKKCCNHSHLIKPYEPTVDDANYLQLLINGSGKMILLDKLLCRLKASGHRVLIFSQMVRLLDIIADYLYLKKFQFQRLDGSIKGEARQRALDHFNAEGSQDFCFLLSTRAGGLGINLASADTVIIFDSDWNPQNDLQAMARAHRIGQKKQVSIYRLVTKCTIEEDIIERAKKKMVLDHLIIQTMDTTGRRVLSGSSRTSNAPFNKEELSSILKFGAAELFKDHDDESDQKLQAMDIDEILQRAETQDSDRMTSLGEDLLSQFKVVNYAAFEEEEVKEKPSSTAMEKLWEEIIPEEERNRIKEEMEKEKKQKQSELVMKQPRNRKTVETKTAGKGPTKKEIKSKEIVETDSSSSSESDAVDDGTEEVVKAKKTPGRKKIAVKKGFTDNEIRRFIKSYKKFARPLTRLDSIAEDAELTDKSTAELLEFSQLLKSSCEQAVKEYQEKLLLDEQFDGKKKGASIRISGVSVNAPSVLKSEVDLEPLAVALPSEKKDQLSFRLTMPTRNVHWGLPWGVVEDSMLLVGMLIYGVGSWDAIKNDPKLELSSKILPIGSAKPQDKHLQTRADYLLKILKQQCNDQTELVEKEKERNKRKKKAAAEQKPKQSSENTKVEKEEKEKPHTTSSAGPEEEKEKPIKKKATKGEKVEKTPKKEKKEKKKKAPKVAAPAPVEDKHHVEIIVNVEEIKLDEATFRKCKEKMRAERKSLQSLQTPDESLSEKEQVQNTKRCLLKIGDHIEKCLDEYNNNPQDLDIWRNNLWSFVAKFTEFGPSKLHKLYRTACRKRDAVRDEHKREIQKLKDNYSNSLHEMGKLLPPDRLEMEEARKRALGQNPNAPVAKIPKLDRIKIPKKDASAHEHDQPAPKRETTNEQYDQQQHYGEAKVPKKEVPTNEHEQHHYDQQHHHGEASGNYGEHPNDEEYPRDYQRRKHQGDNWGHNRRGGGGGGQYENRRGGGHFRGHNRHNRNNRGGNDHFPRGGGHHATSPEENRGEKIQTYREWKESQGKSNVPYDEKPQHNHDPSHAYGKPPYKDRQSSYRDEKYARRNGSSNLSDPREKRGYGDKTKYDNDGSCYAPTPSYLQSPASSYAPNTEAYIPPNMETSCPQNIMEPWSRKRTSSNNSDNSSIGHSNKQTTRDPDHSPNSNQSWSHIGGEGNT